MSQRRDQSTDLVTLLAKRGVYLESLADGTMEKRELVDVHETSRSTVDRAIRDLADAGLVDRAHGSVTLTTAGRLALDAYATFTDRLDGIEDAQSVLTAFDDENDSAATANDSVLDVSLFDDPTVVEASHAPQKPLDEVEAVLREATDLRAIAPHLVPHQVGIHRDRLDAGTLREDIVVTEAVLDELVANHQDTVEAVVQSDDGALFLTDDPPPYGLVVATVDGRELALVVCGIGPVTGVIKNDDPEAVAWAERQFAAVRDDATRLG